MYIYIYIHDGYIHAYGYIHTDQKRQTSGINEVSYKYRKYGKKT